MRLCLAAGRLDVDEALDGLTPEQFDEWLEYLQLEPFGSLPVARQMATLVGAIAAANGVELDEAKLLQAWGYYEPTPPLTQEESDRAMRAAWG